MKTLFVFVVRRSLPAAVAAMLALTGCSTLNHTDRRILHDHGVSPALQAKMVHCGALTLPEIVELSHAGMLPEYITAYIRASHTRYELSDRDGFWLNSQGVSTTVIAYLFATPDLMSRASDRLAIIDWAPYYFPIYGGSLNTFGDETYPPTRAHLKTSGDRSDPTLQKQQGEYNKILGKQPAM